MKKTYKIVYDYNLETIREVYTSFSDYYYSSFATMALYLICFLCTVVVYERFHNTAGILVSMACLLSAFLPFYNRSAMVDQQTKLLNKLSNKTGTVKMTYILDDKTVSCITNTGNLDEYLLSGIIGYRETKNYILLVFNGKMVIPLKKDSFEEGSYEEFMDEIDIKYKKLGLNIKMIIGAMILTVLFIAMALFLKSVEPIEITTGGSQ